MSLPLRPGSVTRPWSLARAGLVLAGSLAALAGDEVRYTKPDPYTLLASKHLLTELAPRNADGTVTAVVEIPAGTTDKWEVDQQTGGLRWEFKSGAPRVVQYLGYPGNYGMVPRTVLSKEQGGDGDPLDVVVLGPALERGAVVHVRVLGMLRMLDGGERDDKLLAVVEGTAFAAVKDVAELDQRFPGVTSILGTWFANYKGPGVTETHGCAGPDEGERLLADAIEAFEREGAPSAQR